MTNDQAPNPNQISRSNDHEPGLHWALKISHSTLFGLLLLKFFPPRQDFLVAAEGSVGIWGLVIGVP